MYHVWFCHPGWGRLPWDEYRCHKESFGGFLAWIFHLCLHWCQSQRLPPEKRCSAAGAAPSVSGTLLLTHQGSRHMLALSSKCASNCDGSSSLIIATLKKIKNSRKAYLQAFHYRFLTVCYLMLEKTARSEAFKFKALPHRVLVSLPLSHAAAGRIQWHAGKDLHSNEVPWCSAEQGKVSSKSLSLSLYVKHDNEH